MRAIVVIFALLAASASADMQCKEGFQRGDDGKCYFLAALGSFVSLYILFVTVPLMLRDVRDQFKLLSTFIQDEALAVCHGMGTNLVSGDPDEIMSAKGLYFNGTVS